MHDTAGTATLTGCRGQGGRIVFRMGYNWFETMPYKDPERKRQWERAHRQQRTQRRKWQRAAQRNAVCLPGAESESAPPSSLERKGEGGAWGLLIFFAAIFLGPLAAALALPPPKEGSGQ